VKFPVDLNSEFLLIKHADHHRLFEFGCSFMISKVIKLIHSNLNLTYFGKVSLYNIIEGFHAKRAYIAFWVDFYFLQDRANFWQTDLF